MSVAFTKVKSVSKEIVTKGQTLSQKVLETAKTISDIVGATLGPGGCPVLIERQEYGLPNMVTKDGVTVFRHLGFTDPIKHAIMEAMRDASVRTANEAGDGTTTATVLAEAIIRNANKYALDNPKVSPQRIVRLLEKTFKEVVEPKVKELSKKVDLESEEGKKLLHSVATISANGDSDLADAVMECYNLVGDNGNVTITEVSGPSHYEVEKISGFPISSGYEESCGKYYPNFLTDHGNSMVKMENPAFIIYHGRVPDFQTILPVLLQVHTACESGNYSKKNVVVVATGFSDMVLTDLATNFPAGTIKVYPLLAPHSPAHNGQLGFLEDLSAITGASMFNPADRPLDGPNIDLAELGNGTSMFEAGRFRSNIISQMNEDGENINSAKIIDRSFVLEGQLRVAESRLDAELLKERLGKLTGGIAKLKVVGSSSGELREKRDRAEDAVMAVRGALKHGVLPGGCWTLIELARTIKLLKNEILTEVLADAFFVPMLKLLQNAGLTDDETTSVISNMCSLDKYTVYDALEQKMVDAFEAGILDSTPAVLEAIRNSISIATLLGTLGGAVVFPRDIEFERREAKSAHDYLRDAGEENPADTRG